jgi:GNAT superfamily N-acetyltransferase
MAFHYTRTRNGRLLSAPQRFGPGGPVSLDLDKVAPQVGEMIGRLRSGLDQRQEVLERALGVMREHSRDVAALRKKIGDSKTTWLVAGLVEGLDGRYAAPLPPAGFAVIATDGSHIEVDRHQAVRCFLLNISHVVLCYGSEPDAVLESVPQLYAEDKDMVLRPPDGRGREQLIEGNLLGARRSVEECRHLADLATALPSGSQAMAVLDGTLMLWGLEPYPDFVTRVLLDDGLLRQFERIRQAGKDKRLAFGSYISAPRSTDVVNALRVAVCPHESANCDRHCQSGGGACDTLAGITDSRLFVSLLAAGERSCLFSSRSKVVGEHYGDHEIHFFYLRVDDEIARVEIPRWVARDKDLVGLAHSLVLDQCYRGHGYPVALSEAHEQAVVTTSDRRDFWQLVEAGLVDQHLPTPTTGKSRSKRMRWV